MIKRRRPAEVPPPTSVVCRYRLSWRERNICPADLLYAPGYRRTIGRPANHRPLADYVPSADLWRLAEDRPLADNPAFSGLPTTSAPWSPSDRRRLFHLPLPPPPPSSPPPSSSNLEHNVKMINGCVSVLLLPYWGACAREQNPKNTMKNRSFFPPAFSKLSLF